MRQGTSSSFVVAAIAIVVAIAAAAACSTASSADDDAVNLPRRDDGADGGDAAGNPATCTDGIKNGTETDVDCGGGTASGCPKCAIDRSCVASTDCVRGTCVAGACKESQNGDECKDGRECRLDAACVDGICCTTKPIATGDSGSTTNTWIRKAPMTLGRYYAAAVTLGGFVYVIGGVYYVEGAGSGAVDKNERYDPLTDTWMDRAPLPAARAGMAAVAFRGRIHVLSGTDHWEYDPVANKWTSLGPIPEAFPGNIGAAVVNDAIHVMSGSTHLAWTTQPEPIGTWTQRAAPLTPLAGPMLARSLANKIVAISGATTQSYDPIANGWTKKADAPSGRGTLSGSFQPIIDGRVIVAGGGSSNVDAYDPATDTWTPLPPILGPARDAMGSTALCGRLYQEGGSTPGASYTLNDVFHAK